MQDTQHQEHYREQSFWDKLKRYAKKAGREVIETSFDPLLLCERQRYATLGENRNTECAGLLCLTY